MKITPIILAALGGLFALGAIGKAAPVESPLPPEADQLLKAVSDTLIAAKSYTFKAEVWEDAVAFGHKISTTKHVEAKVRRPDRLQIEVQSPLHRRGFWYDGKSLVVSDELRNLYGSIPVPETIDRLLDAANDKFGINFPLEDLLVSDPYGNVMEGIKGGVYFGKVTVLGTPCRHFAFGTETVDCQLWIADGAVPLPRKMVITYKQEGTAPQYTAIFSDWNLKAGLTDNTFAFAPPKGAVKIEVLPSADEDENNEGKE